MSNIAEIMSTDVQTIQPQESLRRAAQCMQELDIGSLPVCDGDRLLGMVTDRDITVRGIADGLDPDQACVSDIMRGTRPYAMTNLKSGAGLDAVIDLIERQGLLQREPSLLADAAADRSK